MRRRKPAHTNRSDPGNAFFADPGEGPARAPDDLAELAAEEYVASALSGEEVAYDDRDRTAPEELGGPFTEEQIPPEVMALTEAEEKRRHAKRK
jgi:hypothetical protein